jgi:hypothetical protein
VLITNIDAHTKGGDSDAIYYFSKRRSHHEARHFHNSWCCNCYVPGTCNWLPPAVALEAKVRSIRREIPSRKEACDEVPTLWWIDGA